MLPLYQNCGVCDAGQVVIGSTTGTFQNVSLQLAKRRSSPTGLSQAILTVIIDVSNMCNIGDSSYHYWGPVTLSVKSVPALVTQRYKT
jgi:hypothetical protein